MALYTVHQYLRDTETGWEYYVKETPESRDDLSYDLRRAIISQGSEAHIVSQAVVESARWVLASNQ